MHPTLFFWVSPWAPDVGMTRHGRVAQPILQCLSYLDAELTGKETVFVAINLRLDRNTQQYCKSVQLQFSAENLRKKRGRGTRVLACTAGGFSGWTILSCACPWACGKIIHPVHWTAACMRKEFHGFFFKCHCFKDEQRHAELCSRL